jgi:hypothetical protein
LHYCLQEYAVRRTVTRMNLRDSIDELDALIVEITELRQQMCRAELADDPESALWEAEVGLRHLARRAEARAQVVGRAIELVDHQRSA